MKTRFEAIHPKTRGAWVVHHAQKTAIVLNGAADFPAIDASGKAAVLLSHLASTNEHTITQERVTTLARLAGLNPKTELQSILTALSDQRLVDLSASGDVRTLGLTTHMTAQHAAEFFDRSGPSEAERAAIVVSEICSEAPAPQKQLLEMVSDEFKLTAARANDLVTKSEAVGFIDSEGDVGQKLFFNGNLFRRGHIEKVTKILASLSTSDSNKVQSFHSELDKVGCMTVSDAKSILGDLLFDKLNAAGMYDVNVVSNADGEHGFVTKPSAFHKFHDPLVDDTFDLAKALVSALRYGMIARDSSQGRITMIRALLRKLISGEPVGPATAIGEDYRILELRGVLQISAGPKYGYFMRLLKQDIGQMALAVLTTGDSSVQTVSDFGIIGKMHDYEGPEQTRTKLRKKQIPRSKSETQDILTVLRTGSTI